VLVLGAVSAQSTTPVVTTHLALAIRLAGSFGHALPGLALLTFPAGLHEFKVHPVRFADENVLSFAEFLHRLADLLLSAAGAAATCSDQGYNDNEEPLHA